MLNRLIAISLRRRAAVLVAAVLVSAFGLAAALRLPVDVLPDLNRPTITVMAEAPGFQPEEAELQVAAPIEAALLGAPGSANVRSLAGAGFAVVYAEFEWNSDPSRNRQAVQERLAQLTGLPPGVKPVLLPESSIMGEIMLIALTPNPAADSEAPMELARFAEWTLRPRLLAVPGVAQVTLIGARRRQWQVLADPQAMRIRNVTFAELKEALQQAQSGGGGGSVVEADRGVAVFVSGQARNAGDLAQAWIKTNENAPVKIGDVAEIRAAPQAQRGDAGLNGNPALIVAIQKQPNAGTRQVTAAVDRALDDMRSGLPAGAELERGVFRQSDFIAAAIGNLAESLGAGAALAALVLLLFLFRIRPAAVTMAAIPLSLLATAAVFKLFGQAVNCMTLGGIAIAVGELADDAIVDVENIQRRLAENAARLQPLPAVEVVFSAACEVRSAVVYGTAVVLLALVPLFFLPGLEGRLFIPLAGAYVAAIFVSMAVALTVTPALAYLFMGSAGAAQALVVRPNSIEELKGVKQPATGLFHTFQISSVGPPSQAPSPILRFCKGIALRLCRFGISRPLTMLATVLIFLAAAAAALPGLGTGFLPPFNEKTLTIQVKAWPEISLAESNRLAAQVEQILLSVPEVRATGRRTGRAELDEHAESVCSSEIDVTFWDNSSPVATAPGGPQALTLPPRARAPPAVLRSRQTVLHEIQEKLRDLPALSVSIGQPISHRIDHLLSGMSAPIAIKIRGGDLGVLRGLAARTESALRGISGVVQVQNERPSLVPGIQVRLKRDAAALYGFTSAALTDAVHTVLNGQVLARANSARQAQDVLLWSAEELRQRPEALGGMPLVSPAGAVARLADVADLIDTQGPAEIRHEGGMRQVAVACNITGRDPGGAAEEIQRTVNQALQPALPPGYTVSYGGQYENRRQAGQILWPLSLLALLAASVLLYSHFRALAPVLQVLLNIPFAFIGGVAALALAREPLTLAGTIGFITLAGIASRNGVLMISHYIHLIQHEGQRFDRETIVRGSQERVAPVLMTALTTGLALVPLAFSKGEPGKEMLYPMALVVIGGLISTTLLDFIVTPALFLRFGKGAVDVTTSTKHEA